MPKTFFYAVWIMIKMKECSKSDLSWATSSAYMYIWSVCLQTSRKWTPLDQCPLMRGVRFNAWEIKNAVFVCGWDHGCVSVYRRCLSTFGRCPLTEVPLHYIQSGNLLSYPLALAWQLHFNFSKSASCTNWYKNALCTTLPGVEVPLEFWDHTPSGICLLLNVPSYKGKL